MRSWYGSGRGRFVLDGLGERGGLFVVGGAARHIGREEAHVFEHALHDGVQAARADVLGLLVDLEGKLGHLAQRIGRELEANAFGLKQRGVLLGKRGLGLGENAQEIFDGERLELDANAGNGPAVQESDRWAWRRGRRRRR